MHTIAPIPFMNIMVTLPLSLWILYHKSCSSKGTFGSGHQSSKLTNGKIYAVLMGLFHYSSFLGKIEWAIFLFSNILTHFCFFFVCILALHPSLLHIVCSIYVRNLGCYVFTVLKPSFTQLQVLLSFTTGDLFIAAPELTCRADPFLLTLAIKLVPIFD